MNSLFDGVTSISILLFILGFILLGIEMLSPGISIPGIMGTISLGVGAILSADSIQEGMIFIVIIIIMLCIMFAVAMRILSKGKLKSPIILKEEQNESYQSSNDISYLNGRKGKAVTDLRPSGRGLFDGKEYDVITNGKYIVVGASIEIYEVRGSQITVKEV